MFYLRLEAADGFLVRLCQWIIWEHKARAKQEETKTQAKTQICRNFRQLSRGLGGRFSI